MLKPFRLRVAYKNYSFIMESGQGTNTFVAICFASSSYLVLLFTRNFEHALD